MTSEPRRITPLLVVPAIEERLPLYEVLGFERIGSDLPGVVNLRAGNSYLILATVAAMETVFQPSTVARLVECIVPYVYVVSVAEALRSLPSPSAVLDFTGGPGGPPRAVVETVASLMVLTEGSPGAGWRGDAAVARSLGRLH